MELKTFTDFGRRQHEQRFLICRVELKILLVETFLAGLISFLICRVELKKLLIDKEKRTGYVVPNLPCGVENEICEMKW